MNPRLYYLRLRFTRKGHYTAKALVWLQVPEGISSTSWSFAGPSTREERVAEWVRNG